VPSHGYFRDGLRASACALALLGAFGQGRAADTVPPGAIADLAASAPARAPQIRVRLSWTATGDDGSSGGAATSYDIRYRRDAPITISNWATSTLVAGAPAPSSPGSRQSYTVPGLKPGTLYYFAIRAIDEVGNIGDLGPGTYTTTARYEGYGSSATGGGEQAIVHVTNLNDSGTGSFRTAVTGGGNRTVVFDVAGTIPMNSTVQIGGNNVTIDGASAPDPGITLQATSTLNDGLRFRNVDNVILTYVRFEGNFDWTSAPPNDDTMTTNNSDSSQVSSNLVWDHLTIRNVGDSGADLYDRVQDVTVSWCFFMHNLHTMILGGSDAPSARVTLHHNLWAENGERQPQIAGVRTDLDLRNDVHYNWTYNPHPGAGYTLGSYAIRIRNNDPGGGDVDANIVNNAFVPGPARADAAIVYGAAPGPDPGEEDGPSPCKPQGSVYTGSSMGQLWVSGNTLPSQTCDAYSTVSAERAVPASARVTMEPASALRASVLAGAGTGGRRTDEQSLIATVNGAMGGGALCGNGVKETGETCDGSDLGGASCSSLGLGTGSLGCLADCSAFDSTLCGGAATAPPSVQNLRRTDLRP
jgi:pectate lyase